jgi:hypothetical protein
MADRTVDVAERAALNEDRFRKVNEQIKPANAATAWFGPPMPDWLCECANDDCMTAVQMSVAEYEAVRANSTHFFVAPSTEHLAPGLERIVERHDRYWVVEKIGGAQALVDRLDERTDG